MLKLNASFQKKVPAGEQFSSKSYLASVEVELPAGLTTSQLQDKIHETFELVQQSVEREIHARTASAAPAKHQRSEGRPERSSEPPVKATNKQIQFILKLGQGRQKGLAELNTMAADLFKVSSIYELSKGEASKLVDQLKLAA